MLRASMHIQLSIAGVLQSTKEREREREPIASAPRMWGGGRAGEEVEGLKLGHMWRAQQVAC